MNIKKITDSFADFSYDLETTKLNRVLYFWTKDKENKFFFEIPGDSCPRVRILIEEEWQTFEDENIENLIQKTIEIIKN